MKFMILFMHPAPVRGVDQRREKEKKKERVASEKNSANEKKTRLKS